MSSAACAQVDVAAWLVLLAHEQREMELVRSTLSSLLATSRWELLNAGRGIVMHDVVFDLLKRLAAHSLAAASSRSERSSDSSTGSNLGVSEPAATAQLQLPQVTTPPSAAGAGEVVGAAVAGVEAGSASTAARLSSLGRELLQPQLLGQLLHVSQGLSPWRLLTVVELVDWWGLGTTPQQQQGLQQEAQQPMPQPAAAQVEEQAHQQQQLLPQGATAAPGSPTAEAGNKQQQAQQHVAQRQSSSGNLAAMRNNMVVLRSSSSASLSSDGSGNDDSSVASSSSSGSGSGDAACDVLSPCVTGPQADAGAGSSPGAVRLVAANSVEVGSLQSDDCQQANTWLDDLISKGAHSRNAATNSTGGVAVASATAQQQQQKQAETQVQQVCTAEQQQQQLLPKQQPVHAPQPCAHGEPKHLDLGKEWGGSWQQLTGQVAQLHMTSPGARQQQQCGSPPLRSPTHPSAPLRQPRCSFDYEQHVAQQLRRRQQQQGQDEQVRRGSSPGRYPSSVAAARQLRSSLSQPAAPRCPVHPYMQQSSGQQHQHEP
jgi:hypothetical protein